MSEVIMLCWPFWMTAAVMMIAEVVISATHKTHKTHKTYKTYNNFRENKL